MNSVKVITAIVICISGMWSWNTDKSEWYGQIADTDRFNCQDISQFDISAIPDGYKHDDGKFYLAMLMPKQYDPNMIDTTPIVFSATPAEPVESIHCFKTIKSKVYHTWKDCRYVSVATIEQDLSVNDISDNGFRECRICAQHRLANSE